MKAALEHSEGDVPVSLVATNAMQLRDEVARAVIAAKPNNGDREIMGRPT
jgi:predicted dienelactone hydrolase